MTAKQALTKARKVLGDKAHVSHYPKAMDKEQKATLRAAYNSLRMVPPSKRTEEQRRTLDAMSSQLLSFRCIISEAAVTVGGIAIARVRAQGDTWEECLEKMRGQ